MLKLNLPKLFLPRRCLGVDIGTSLVKMVEISKLGHRLKLENYGSLSASILYQKPFRTFDKNTLLLSGDDVAKTISALLEETKIKTRQAVFSIPDFSTFFTNFELPKMTKEEIPQAVKYEARQHIPVPLGEGALDWQVINNHLVSEKNEKLKILLVAVPNEVINQYQEIAKMCELKLVSLEAEVFGLLRSLVPKEETKIVGLLDIGAQSTTYSIIDKGVLKISHSFDLAGNELTEQIAKSLSIDYTQAENLKRKYGLQTDQNIKNIIAPLIDSILRETERISNNFLQSENKEVAKFIIAGGVASIPGIKEYFQEHSDKETEIANPFLNIYC